MKNFIKAFCLRGLMIMGFGPLVYAVVMFILYLCGVDTLSNGVMIFKGIISTSIVAFIAAGATTIYQYEKLGPALSAVIHGVALYISYLIMYLVNGWLQDNGISVLIFSVIFVVCYGIIWLIIYFTEKGRAKSLNSQLK